MRLPLQLLALCGCSTPTCSTFEFSSYLFKNRYFSVRQHHVCCCGDNCDVASGDMTSLVTPKGQKHEDAVWLYFFIS